jgi:hypothetical protein
MYLPRCHIRLGLLISCALPSDLPVRQAKKKIVDASAKFTRPERNKF